MWYFNLTLTRLFDVILAPFRWWPPGGLLLVSALTGVLMLLIFKRVSNQARIRRAKDLIKAHILALRLFRDEPGVLMASQRQVLRANLTYLRYAVLPIIFILPPVVLIMVQLNLRYGEAPARVGHPVVVTAAFNQALDDGVALTAPAGVRVETEALRAAYDNEVSWRVRPVAAGVYTLRVQSRDRVYEKEFAAGGGGTARLSARRVRGLWAQLMNPGERPLDGDLREIRVQYEPRRNTVFGLAVPWVITFFVASLVAAFALKGVLRAEI